MENLQNVENTEHVIRYSFAAPKSVVFNAFIDAHKLARWWGPHGFTNPVADLDPRPGGAISVDMRGPDGKMYPMQGTVDEIEEPDLLVLTTTAMPDESGEPQLVVKNSLMFDQENGRTTLTSRAVIQKASSAAKEAAGGMEEGWRQSMEKLADYLTKARAGSHLGR